MSNYSPWSQNSIIYHIYVRSFRDLNGDGIGDLNGIIEKLDYIKSLSVDAVWLSPIYKSPQNDFGYDVADYKEIDPSFGNLTDFKKLLNKAHQKNIKVMMDFVPNHTSSEHKWFEEARTSLTSPLRDFYIWQKPNKAGGSPNNWLSVFGGSAWELDQKTGEYYLHSFDKTQPDLNWRNPEVVKEMLDILKFWLDLGVDGFRVDAIEWMFKDKDFADEPLNPNYPTTISDPYHTLLHTKTYNLPEVTEVIKKFTHVLEKYDSKFMVVEVWAPLDETIKWYAAIEKHWFTPFNFGLILVPWKAKEHKKFIDQYDLAVGELYYPTYVLGNHDRPRIASRIGRQQAKVAAMLLLTLRGMPYIYNGEEIGMEDGKIPQEKIKDPFEIKTPGLGLGRDPERTPLQWSNGENAGFTNVEPWLPVADNYQQINIENEEKDPQSILNLYKKIIEFRHNSKALTSGKYLSFDSGNEEVFLYLRVFEEDNVLIALNYSSEKQSVSSHFSAGQIIIDTNFKKTNQKINLENFTLDPNEGLIIQL